MPTSPSPSWARRFEWAGVFILIACLYGVEAAYFLGEGNRLQRYAALYWIGCSVLTISSACAFAFRSFFDRSFWRLEDRVWYLVAFFLPPILILVDGGGIRFTNVDGEGVEQAAVGINLLRHDPSLGVFKMAYGTYLARQYILNSLPSYFFGPSLWTLRVGNSLFFLASYPFFLSAFAAYLRARQVSRPLLLASYCGIMISLADYTILNARKFEQTTMPIAATLFFLGALLLFLVSRTPFRFLWVTWAFGFFAECYTPAMGSWVLALGVLLYLVFRLRQRVLIVSIVYGCISACVAYLVLRAGDNISLTAKFGLGSYALTLGDHVQRYAQGLRGLAGFEHPLLPTPLVFAIVASLCLSWRYRETRFHMVCLWALAMAFASLTFVGTCLNMPGHDLHRALIILPPLAVGVVLILARYLAEEGTDDSMRKVVRFAMSLSMAYMVFAGACTVFLVRAFYYSSATEDDYDEVCYDFNRLAQSPGTVHPMRIYFVPPLDIDLARSIWFFDPDATVYSGAPPPGERVPGTYIFSYRVVNPKDRLDDAVIPSRHPRPFIQVENQFTIPGAATVSRF
jgi:hypothetical protein